MKFTNKYLTIEGNKAINEIASIIAHKYHPEKIILFGSYASNTQTQGSDVDLLIILRTNRSCWDISIEISLMVPHRFPIDIIVKTPQQIEQRMRHGDFFIKEVIENGKVLYEKACQ